MPQSINHPPTDEQSAILDLARTSPSNLMLRAYAGSGKTSTLEMIEKVVKSRPILYLVFSKRNQIEAEKRMESTTTVRTFNSLGHRIWAKACNKNLILNTKKSNEILRELIRSAPRDQQTVLWEVYYDVLDGVNRAKVLGYVPDGKYTHAKRLVTQAQLHRSLESRPDDLVSDLIDAVLTTSIRWAYDGIVDFNDQIYMPALFGGVYPQFPLVLVDEYQDLNPTNHAMLDKLVKHRVIGVGDPYQNIYQFRGAKAAGMDDAAAKFKMQTAPLSISFRCPSAIVEHVQWHVPDFKAFKEGGSVATLNNLDSSTIVDRATILCRNNAPLLSFAFKLLASGRSVRVAGSDIGPKLINIMRKLGPDDCSRSAFQSAINDWEAEKLDKESTTARDLAECMRVLAALGDSKSQAILYAEHLFKQEGSIQLMTGHKSKGLEFPIVYHLDPYLLDDNEADRNLSYVISTRAQEQLFEVNSSDVIW